MIKGDRLILSLQGRTALVTGGGSGIGAACARTLARAGVSVLIADRAIDQAEALASELGGGSVACPVEVTDEASCAAMVAAAMARFGRLDIAVNNAGIGNRDRSKVADLPYATWQNLLNVNLNGVFLSMKAEIPAMLASGGGSIINIASIMGTVSVGGACSYVAAKHGVVGLTKAAALDYAADGIRVNAVGPGFIDTPMLSNRTPEQMAEIAAQHPVGRLGTAEEIANLVAFLAAPESSFTTGAYYIADGGYTAR